MQVIFTLCSNNYLPQALSLAESASRFQPGWKFVIGLVDRLDTSIDYKTFETEIVTVETVEPAIESLAKKFSIVELNTCVKPAFFEYFFQQRNATEVLYLDPDTRLYHSLEALQEVLLEHEIVLTPHILSPIPLDGQRPNEPLFLNYGIYNLGFLALKRSQNSLQLVDWWKQRVYHWGYDQPCNGLFTDQLWMNFAPVFFEKVYVLRNPGYNMAPWNLHERRLSRENETILVNGQFPLVFFHFSSVAPGQDLLHREYNRFLPGSRPDLEQLYREYRNNLESLQYAELRVVPCYYDAFRQQVLQQQAEQQQLARQQQFDELPYHKKLVRQIRSNIPEGLKNFLKS